MNLPRIFSNAALIMSLLFLSHAAPAQVDSASNGSDGAFNPTEDTVIDMADHSDGIYHYTSVNIPNGVTVTFIPNANNTPVIWLVQSNCVVSGSVNLSGQSALSWLQVGPGGEGGPGGYRGGNGGVAGTSGQGPGGGAAGGCGEPAAFGAHPTQWTGGQYVTLSDGSSPYGSQYLLPLIGGSGGGGGTNAISGNCSGGGGGGGGGAILIAASQNLELTGSIVSLGGSGAMVGCGYGSGTPGGAGSGGSVRLVATRLSGNGAIIVSGGGGCDTRFGGKGRVRFDALENNYGGQLDGVFSQGSQFIMFPNTGQFPQLTVTSVGGVPVSASPTGELSAPDAALSAQQSNPIPIVVHCSSIPLNTQITVSVRPANGVAVSATGLNSNGTLSSSTATILINMPRGGGIMYATAATSN